jgi:hypothetical protein
VGEGATAGGWLVRGGTAAARVSAVEAAVRDGSAARRVNGLVGETLGRCTPAARALWDAAGWARTRLTLAGRTAALGVALAVLAAAWAAAR